MTTRPIDKLTIIQHNIRHWDDKRHALTNIYNDIDADIILINDHSLTNDRRLKIFNYSTFQTNKTNSQHRGAAIAIRHNLDFRLLDDFDSDMLGLTIQTRHGPITIATTYIPPNSPYLNYIDFNSLLDRPEPVYILGDLNARHPTLGHRDRNPVGRAIDNLINNNKCKLAGPTFPTLIRHNSATSPDIVLTNNRDYHNLHLRPGPMTPSDHIPIIATINSNPIQIPIKPRPQTAKANWTSYKQELTDHRPPRSTHPTLEEIDEYLDKWTKQIQETSNKSIPTLRYRITPTAKQTDDIKTLTILYNEAIEHIRQNGPSLELTRYINDLKRQLTTDYRLIQNQAWNELISKLDTETDPTKFWKTIKRLQGNNKQKIPYLRDSHNNKLHTPQEKEVLFRKHWTKIFTADDDEDNNFDYDFITDIERQLDRDFDQIKTLDYGDVTRLNANCPPITMTELKATLRTFKQKAPGPTGITALHLKNLPPNMLDLLLYIFNNALSAGYFPDSLKTAKIIFIPKGNTSQYDVKNYRPISLLDVHGKLFDKILNTRLTNFLDRHNLTNTRQHGFRRNRGTHTALALFYETLSNNRYNNRTTDVILRDVTKAFDKVWHTGLKYKILKTGLPTYMTRTICDFITDRTATIQIDGYSGPSFPLDSGVPQGACLSPSLYNLYTHDMPPPLPTTDYIAFADDITQLTYGHYNYKYATQNTEHAIRQINDFERRWKIRTNRTKFKIIPIGRHKTLTANIDDSDIHYTTTGKILGLNFSTRSIVPHIKIRTAIANTALTKLYRFSNLSTHNKKKLYTSIVRSALIYPPVPLNTITNNQMRTLQRIQNKATRFILNTRLTDRNTSQSLHQRTNLPTINTIIHRQAKDTWDRLEQQLPDIHARLTLDRLPDRLNSRQRTNRGFPSSREAAERPPPDPIYT